MELTWAFLCCCYTAALCFFPEGSTGKPLLKISVKTIEAFTPLGSQQSISYKCAMPASDSIDSDAKSNVILNDPTERMCYGICKVTEGKKKVSQLNNKIRASSAPVLSGAFRTPNQKCIQTTKALQSFHHLLLKLPIIDEASN